MLLFQGVLYDNLSISSIITTVPTALSSSTVYYAPLPYRYSNVIGPVTFLTYDAGTEDHFGFVARDNNNLASPLAAAAIVSLHRFHHTFYKEALRVHTHVGVCVCFVLCTAYANIDSPVCRLCTDGGCL